MRKIILALSLLVFLVAIYWLLCGALHWEFL